MSAFLSRLVARSRTPIGTLRPRARPAFEPWPRAASFADAATEVQAVEVERIAPRTPRAAPPTVTDPAAMPAQRPPRAATHLDRPPPTRSGPPRQETDHRSVAVAAPGHPPRVPTRRGETADSSARDPGLLDPSSDGPSPSQARSIIRDDPRGDRAPSHAAHASAPRGATAGSRPPETHRPDADGADVARSDAGSAHEAGPPIEGRRPVPVAVRPQVGQAADPEPKDTVIEPPPVDPDPPGPWMPPGPAVDARPRTTPGTPDVATTDAGPDDIPPASDVPTSSGALVVAEPPLPAGGVEPDTPGVVNVTIGRVEVRAVQAPAPRRRPERRPPTVSLDDYLQRRGSG